MSSYTFNKGFGTIIKDYINLKRNSFFARVWSAYNQGHVKMVDMI